MIPIERSELRTSIPSPTVPEMGHGRSCKSYYLKLFFFLFGMEHNKNSSGDEGGNEEEIAE